MCGCAVTFCKAVYILCFGSSVGSVMGVLAVSEMIGEDVPSAHAYLISFPSFPVPTGPPQGLMVTSRTATTITLSWMDPAPDRINDRDGITGFVVRRNGERVARIKDRSYTVTGLTPATSYDFEVLARNHQGIAHNSNAAHLNESTDSAPTPIPSPSTTTPSTSPSTDMPTTSPSTVSPTPPPQGKCNIQLVHHIIFEYFGSHSMPYTLQMHLYRLSGYSVPHFRWVATAHLNWASFCCKLLVGPEIRAAVTYIIACANYIYIADILLICDIALHSSTQPILGI